MRHAEFHLLGVGHVPEMFPGPKYVFFPGAVLFVQADADAAFDQGRFDHTVPGIGFEVELGSEHLDRNLVRCFDDERVPGIVGDLEIGLAVQIYAPFLPVVIYREAQCRTPVEVHDGSVRQPVFDFLFLVGRQDDRLVGRHGPATVPTGY